jgi:competence protein ComEC
MGLLVASTLVAGGLWLAVATPTSGDARITILDVGQGLAVLVEDRGARVLIDTGPPDGALLEALSRRDTGSLDAVLITHADADHVGGLSELVRRRSVGAVLASNATIIDAELDGARAIDIGDRIALSDRTTIEVLSPPVATALPAHAERNDGSLVLLISVGELRILVAADIEAAGERWLIDSGQALEADALVVPHHGSASSSSPAFVEAVDPAVAIISVGARNQFGHPATVILARYSEVRLLRTDEHGDVSLVTNGIELRVETDGE